MKKSNFALRLQPSLMKEAKKVAQAEGVAMNQLINVAVAEKVSALRTEEYFAERAAKKQYQESTSVASTCRYWQPTNAGRRTADDGASSAARNAKTTRVMYSGL